MNTLSTYEEFQQSRAQDPWTLLYVSTSWCGPCKQFGPIVEKTSNNFANILTTLKVDPDEVPEVAQEFQIRSVPTLLLMHNGQVVEGATGLQSPEQLSNWLTSHVLAH